jgi:hypothetical protein
MFKKLSLPLAAVLSFQFAFAPVASAAYNKDLYEDLLKDIYKKSDEGDGGDIYRIIKKALEKNPSEGTDLVNKLINELEDNLDDLAFDVSKEDLRRIKRQLRRYIRNRAAFVFTGNTNQGNVAPPESNTMNN